MRHRRNKHNNRKVEVDGHVFDSVGESKRYLELKLLQRAEIIRNLEIQPKLTLKEKFTDNRGKKHREITYTADFTYLTDPVGDVWQVYVEDYKGYKTEVYKIKKKLFIKKYPHIVFVETTKDMT